MLKSMLTIVCLFVGASSSNVTAQESINYTCQITDQVSMEPCSCCSYTQAVGISVVESATPVGPPEPAPPCILPPDDATDSEFICYTQVCIMFRTLWDTCGWDQACQAELIQRYIQEVFNCDSDDGGIAQVAAFIHEFDYLDELTDGNMKQALIEVLSDK